MMDPRALVGELKKVAEGEVLTDHPLAPYTSYKIGGPAAVWVAPGSEQAVGRVLEVLSEVDVPLFIMGRGSNLLVADEGWPGIVIYLGENLSGWSIDGEQAFALAGSSLMDFIRDLVAHGLEGMELMSGIPGGVGGALRMNAGAFGQEIESSVKEVHGFSLEGRPFRATRQQIRFGYRAAPELGHVAITSATFELEKEDPQILTERMEDVLALRTKKQPLEFPSCGSVFKRPPGYYAGALIEEVGFKGRRHGNAQVADKHAGFILNLGGATAQDVRELMEMIADAVEDRFGVRLEREVKMIGFRDLDE